MSSSHDPSQQIRAALVRERDRLYEEIKSYPPPIAACDEQFDDLLERRDRVARELARLSENAGTRTPDDG